MTLVKGLIHFWNKIYAIGIQVQKQKMDHAWAGPSAPDSRMVAVIVQGTAAINALPAIMLDGPVAGDAIPTLPQRIRHGLDHFVGELQLHRLISQQIDFQHDWSISVRVIAILLSI